MKVLKQIDAYIATISEPKQSDLKTLHEMMVQQVPARELWFLDGKNKEGKTVSNPSIGYGTYQIKYADGTSRAFYKIGLSANSTGISVYLMGFKDKNYLTKTYGKELGKAKLSGYCIHFKFLRQINIPVLETAIRHRLQLNEEDVLLS